MHGIPVVCVCFGHVGFMIWMLQSGAELAFPVDGRELSVEQWVFYLCTYLPVPDSLG